MGFLDKLKNVFFEEEEVEEEEVEVKEKLARKVEIPKKKLVQVEPKKEISKEDLHEEIKVKTVPKEEVVAQKELEDVNHLAMMFEEEDFVLEEQPRITNEVVWERSEKKELYPEKKEESYMQSVKKENNYGYTKSYYESKETKTFTPSPIISPIYGILDKNYKKEEVVTKKEIKIISNRKKVDLDSVRIKAFGDTNNEEITKSTDIKHEKEERIYDVNANKPSVKGVTLEDADEYYRDLGLAYNVDYRDKAKDNSTKKNSDTLEDNLFDLIESMYDKED